MYAKMMKNKLGLLLGGILTSSMAFSGPPIPQASDLTVKVEYVGQVPTNAISSIPNMASPVVHKNELLIVDQQGALYRWSSRDGQYAKIFDVSQAPSELTFYNDVAGGEAILNVVGSNAYNKIYMVLSSKTLPSELNAGPYKTNICHLPTDGSQKVCDLPVMYETHPTVTTANGSNTFDIYHFGSIVAEVLPGLGWFEAYEAVNQYQILYEFTYDGQHLSNPRAILALENQGGSATHHGGGMALAQDGRIIWAISDSMFFGVQGRRLPQENSSYVGKILLIDPNTGAMEVAVKGQRNVQRVQLVVDNTSGQKILAWNNIGGWVAEELNTIDLKDFIDTSVIENYGWGCDKANNTDGNCDFALAKSREGNIYVGFGIPFTGFTPPEIGQAPIPEAGFVQPQSQYGRLPGFSYAAATGPAISKKSFSKITALYGDLPSGMVIATTADLLSRNAIAYQVNLVDANGNALPTNTLHDLNGGQRADPRFFVFPDGTAGVLLEKTGKFYRLTEIVEE